MAPDAKVQPKGHMAEELLREYFLELGYYAVRGIKFVFQGEDVTDIDLWLYHRHSPISRERINVDIKNKKTPQAIERILWTRGLQVTLGLDRCIVATTDNRQPVVDFGREHGVVVLDGTFFNSLKSRAKAFDRLSEEEFDRLLDADNLGKLGGNWRQRVQLAKTAIVTHLGYDGCNGWLADIGFFVEQSETYVQRAEAAVRTTYLLISYFLIGLDFALSKVVFESQESKKAAIAEGLWHGSEGKKRTETVLHYASQIASHYLNSGEGNAARIQRELRAVIEQMPVGIIAEHFSKVANLNQIFQSAKRFEAHAFEKKITWPSVLPADLKAIIGVLLDCLKQERARFFRVGGTDDGGNGTDRKDQKREQQGVIPELRSDRD